MIVALYSKEMFLFPFITDNSFLFTLIGLPVLLSFTSTEIVLLAESSLYSYFSFSGTVVVFVIS